MQRTCDQYISQFTGGKKLLEHTKLIESEDEVRFMINQIDPYNNKLISFSQIIQMLSSYMIPSEQIGLQPEIPFLEKFVNLLKYDQAQIDELNHDLRERERLTLEEINEYPEQYLEQHI